MRKNVWKTIIPLLVLIAAIAGCTWIKKPPATATTTTAGTSNMITIEAGSYSFEPKLIRLEKPGSFILQVKNTTGSEQNLTLKSPRGKIVKALNVGPKATGISNIDLEEIGSYEFYSDKRFHSTLLSKGHIVVGAGK